MAKPLAGELAEYHRLFEENRETAVDLCANLSHAAFNWRPADSRWSVGECLAHLNISATLLGEAALRAAHAAWPTPRVSRGRTRHGLVSRIMLWSLDPTNRWRFKAPRRFVPPAAQYDVETVLGEFIASQRQWDECLNAAVGLDLGRVKVPSPAIPLLRFPLGATFAIQVTHERRHLHQARLVTATPGFPASPVEES